MRIQPDIVLNVERRDIQTLCANLTVVLRKRRRTAQHEIRESISAELAIESEIPVPRKIAEGVQLRVNPVSADRNLVSAADQVEIFRELPVIRDPGTRRTVLAGNREVALHVEEQIIWNCLRHTRAQLRRSRNFVRRVTNNTCPGKARAQ